MEIALDGVQRSSRYPGGVALRFARVRRYRPDKTPLEADTIEAVQAMLYALGYLVFGVRPSSWPLLVLASLSATVAFCGFMMLVATLGKTEQAASGTAWAIMMPLSMIGGGMIPQFLMPAWMSTLGNISPIKWAIRAIEGALWREFTLAEMLLPCTILIIVGLACFAIGTRRLQVT